ncbi:hypothetical protein LTR47_011493 [Exophiala xenobiotica]|nr:hypothetical protein LTR41_011511 [Exophiala xenobiotica]KAK5219702.1 hypothetical protein LTR47_011493 [Exophiala xenobiotica]KAK5243886.1 hypothetical protein LTS06_010434 [Exophiala xenobiotica]KAK5282162.1 hypothetical protein LTR40_003718 [Exophiala xenobiotica]KAK5344684.1 hypothetical protein LTR61_011540 [Exophiala xenobiotica]
MLPENINTGTSKTCERNPAGFEATISRQDKKGKSGSRRSEPRSPFPEFYAMIDVPLASLAIDITHIAQLTACVPNHETKLPEYEAIRPKQVISFGTRMTEARMRTAVEPAYLGLLGAAKEEATAVGGIDLYDKELGPEEDVPVPKTKVEHEADDSSEGKDRSDGHDEEEDIGLGGGRHDHDGREHGDVDGIRPIARNPKGGTSQKLQLRQTPHHKGNSELRRFLQPSMSVCYHSNPVR